MRTAFVLLSGGIDSTTCLYIAMSQGWDKIKGVSVYYGQRHKKEIEHAKRICDTEKIQHHVIDISSVVPKTMLTDPNAVVPSISYADIQGVSPTYVPFRNGLLLSTLASYAQGSLFGEHSEAGVFFGAHAEDAHNWAYPDCTPEFIGAMANAIYIGSYHKIRLHTPLEWLDKVAIIQLGEQIGVRWQDTWSCYVGADKHCGVCPTCRARKAGFSGAGVKDPTEYENTGEVP